MRYASTRICSCRKHVPVFRPHHARLVTPLLQPITHVRMLQACIITSKAGQHMGWYMFHSLICISVRLD